MTDRFEHKVVISGVGQSEIGRRLGRDPVVLTAEACLRAIADAGLAVTDIDGLATYPGSTSPGPGFTGAGLRDVQMHLGITTTWCEGGIETSGQLGAVVNAMLAVAGGAANHVLVWRSLWEGSAQGTGGRKAYSVTDVADGLPAWQLPYGATAVSLAALMVRARMHRYGLTREQLAWGPIVSRRHAGMNPSAVYRDPLSLEDYLSARMISTPMCLYDCDVPCDAATAVVVSRAEHASGLDHPAVAVEAISSTLDDRYQWEGGRDVTRMSSSAAGEIWERTDLRPADIDYAALYDGFSVFTHCWLEDLGFCEVGDAGAFVEGGERISLGGELPMNTDGGQLSGGRLHGYGFLHEACLQVRGEATGRQVEGAQTAAVGVGASNSGTTAMILRRA